MGLYIHEYIRSKLLLRSSSSILSGSKDSALYLVFSFLLTIHSKIPLQPFVFASHQLKESGGMRLELQSELWFFVCAIIAKVGIVSV